MDSRRFQGVVHDQADSPLQFNGNAALWKEMPVDFPDLVPYGVKSRTLARLAVLDARHEFEQAHWKAGWDDVVALLRLARHVESDPS